VDVPIWNPRRVAAVAADLPDGVTPPGTRGRILHAGLELFAETGFHGTSIRAIANRVGMNSATLYAHYPSKEQVLAELVLIGHQEMATRLTTALDTLAPEAGAADQLEALVHVHVLLHTEFPLLAVVTNGELHALSPELAAPALELRDSCRRMLVDVLGRGVKDGVFHTPDILLTAAAISGLGVQVAQWFGPDQPYSGRQVADVYARLALRIAGVAGAA
jgi:AcrR family transcriptional regulator